MKRLLIVVAVLIIGGGVWLATQLLFDPGLDLTQYAFEREQSRPADCFPGLTAEDDAEPAAAWDGLLLWGAPDARVPAQHLVDDV